MGQRLGKNSQMSWSTRDPRMIPVWWLRLVLSTYFNNFQMFGIQLLITTQLNFNIRSLTKYAYHFQVHIIGEIASASGFSHSSLFCKYKDHCIFVPFTLHLHFHSYLHLYWQGGAYTQVEPGSFFLGQERAKARWPDHYEMGEDVVRWVKYGWWLRWVRWSGPGEQIMMRWVKMWWGGWDGWSVRWVRWSWPGEQIIMRWEKGEMGWGGWYLRWSKPFEEMFRRVKAR